MIYFFDQARVKPYLIAIRRIARRRCASENSLGQFALKRSFYGRGRIGGARYASSLDKHKPCRLEGSLIAPPIAAAPPKGSTLGRMVMGSFLNISIQSSSLPVYIRL